MTGWLITWNWAGHPPTPGVDEVVAVLNYRESSRTVSKILELLYALSTATVEEICRYARNRKVNPYLAIDCGTRISCGAGPFLEARKVTDLRVEKARGTNGETVCWEEPLRWRIRNKDTHEVEFLGPGRRVSVRRSVIGAPNIRL